MPSLEDVRAITAALSASEERATSGGAAWFVKNKLYAWVAHPWPSVPADIRAVIERESVFVVKVQSEEDKLAYREGWPEVFLRQTTGWSEPKIAFRLAAVKLDMLVELVTEGWYSQAPRYLKREFDDMEQEVRRERYEGHKHDRARAHISPTPGPPRKIGSGDERTFNLNRAANI